MGLAPRRGWNPMSCMNRNATTRVTPSIAARRRKGTPRSVTWATTPPRTEPTSIAAPLTVWARPKTDSRPPANSVACSASTSHASVAPEKNVKPRPSRIEASAQPEEARVDLPHDVVEDGGRQEGRRPEQEREASTARVGDDAGRHLEDDLADGEERVGRERLGVGQAGVEEEEGVDAPDERRGERREEGQHEVRPLDGSGGRGRGHGRDSTANRPCLALRVTRRGRNEGEGCGVSRAGRRTPPPR